MLQKRVSHRNTDNILSLSESINRIHSQALGRDARSPSDNRLPSPKRRPNPKKLQPLRQPRKLRPKRARLHPLERARLVRSPRLVQGSFFVLRDMAMVRSLR